MLRHILGSECVCAIIYSIIFHLTLYFLIFCSTGIHWQILSSPEDFISDSRLHRESAGFSARHCFPCLCVGRMGLSGRPSTANSVGLLQARVRWLRGWRRVVHWRQVDICMELVLKTDEEALLLCVSVHWISRFRWRLEGIEYDAMWCELMWGVTFSWIFWVT